MSFFSRSLIRRSVRKQAPGAAPTYRGPKIAALDYRSGAPSTGSFNVAMLKKYDIVILNMQRGQAAEGAVGYNCVQLMAVMEHLELPISAKQRGYFLSKV
jgi:hypothetical protein